MLIIDEINRGNVASIFGELITLIEDDKREGGDEPARVKLPYSKEDFSVTVEPLPPRHHEHGGPQRGGLGYGTAPSIQLRGNAFAAGADRTGRSGRCGPAALLNTINERVEQLLDKDHHIGHSYFMGLKTGEDLKRVFATKVIPLLEEYFHGDAKKVGAVRG